MLAYNISQSTLWVVGIFLFITLIVGLYAGRGIKNIKEYALASGRFSTFTLTLTLLATYIGGGATIGTVGEVYSIGVIIILAYFGFIIHHLIFAFIISPKIAYFKNCLTLGDIVERLYGKKAKIVTGILTLFYSIISISIQFFMIGKIFNSFLGINTSYGIIIGGVILGIYSAIGGIKAVTITDVLQFIVLIIFIPLIAMVALKEVGGYKELFINIPKEKFIIFNNKGMCINNLFLYLYNYCFYGSIY